MPPRSLLDGYRLCRDIRLVTMAGFADRFAIYNDDQRRKIAEIIGRVEADNIRIVRSDLPTSMVSCAANHLPPARLGRCSHPA